MRSNDETPIALLESLLDCSNVNKALNDIMSGDLETKEAKEFSSKVRSLISRIENIK